MKQLSYRKYIHAFLIIITFIISVSVACLSNKIDTIEDQVNGVKQYINHLHK